jgi:hypothetical protein
MRQVIFTFDENGILSDVNYNVTDYVSALRQIGRYAEKRSTYVQEQIQPEVEGEPV